MTRPKATLVTTLWGRRGLSRACLEHHARIAADPECPLDLSLVAAGSEDDPNGDPRADVEAAGWHYVEHANQPLGTKYNATLDVARTLDPAGVIVIGSDDFLSPDLFRVYAARASSPLVGFRDIWFADLKTGKCVWWSGYGKATTRLIGAGRWYGREVLEACKWRLWPALPSGLDTMAEYRIASLCPRLAVVDRWSPLKWTRLQARDHGIMVDVKSAVNMTKWDALMKVADRIEAAPFSPLVDRLGSQTGQALRALEGRHAWSVR